MVWHGNSNLIGRIHLYVREFITYLLCSDSSYRWWLLSVNLEEAGPQNFPATSCAKRWSNCFDAVSKQYGCPINYKDALNECTLIAVQQHTIVDTSFAPQHGWCYLEGRSTTSALDLYCRDFLDMCLFILLMSTRCLVMSCLLCADCLS